MSSAPLFVIFIRLYLGRQTIVALDVQYFNDVINKFINVCIISYFNILFTHSYEIRSIISQRLRFINSHLPAMNSATISFKIIRAIYLEISHSYKEKNVKAYGISIVMFVLR